MSAFVEQFSVGNRTNLLVGVKDNIDIVGFVTGAGSKALENKSPASSNADVIDSIIQSGNGIVGKLNMHELAYGMTGVNDFTGTPVNHLFPNYIPGGSSSGCAVAVAQGSIDFSIGTDTGGSIRVPAACCGVFGFKPTFDRISRQGVTPAESTLDCVGPMSMSAAGIIKAMQIIDSSFVPVSSNKDIRLGRVDVTADESIWQAVDEALKNPLAAICNKTLPSFQAAFDAGMTLMNAEMWQSFSELAQSGKLGADVASRLQAASKISQADIAHAETIRQQFTQEVDDALSDVDALVMPTLPAFPLDREQALAGKSDLTISNLTRPFNLSGHPALTMPLKNSLGKPMALQIIGAKGKDELVCEIAKELSDKEIN